MYDFYIWTKKILLYGKGAVSLNKKVYAICRLTKSNICSIVILVNRHIVQREKGEKREWIHIEWNNI